MRRICQYHETNGGYIKTQLVPHRGPMFELFAALFNSLDGIIFPANQKWG